MAQVTVTAGDLLFEEARHTYFLESIVICTVAFHFYLFPLDKYRNY